MFRSSLVMNRRDVPQLLELARRLGEEFSRREMHEHVQRLRVYWLAARHGLLRGRNELDVKWSEAHLVAWLEALQLPPYQAVLPVQAPGAGCPRCGAEPGLIPSGRTVLVFPGGARFRCGGCGAEWLAMLK
jgi:hypothetical protein